MRRALDCAQLPILALGKMASYRVGRAWGRGRGLCCPYGSLKSSGDTRAASTQPHRPALQPRSPSRGLCAQGHLDLRL